MTLPANSKPFSETLPSEEAQAVANQLRRLLASAREGEIELYAHPSSQDEATKIDLHPVVSDVLLEVLRYIGSGDAVTLLPITKALTTQQAADILNMSRPSLVKLLENGDIPYTSVGRHRRVKAQDLFDYKRDMAQVRAAALAELAESDADLLQMFANRYTVFVDACSLVGVLRRNILLSMAEAELFRLRWSEEILDETETAIQRLLIKKSLSKEQAASKSHKAVSSMRKAFPEAKVIGYSIRHSEAWALPDEGDAHVIAAAVHTRASMIVTENLKDFPSELLTSLGLEAKSSDEFIADAIELDEGLAVAAVARMRARFNKPEMSAEDLLRKMESQGLTSTSASLDKYKNSL